MDSSKSNGQYEVLSPWAEADPIPLRGINPRLKDLEGRKIGLYANWKQPARPILTLVEKKLKEKFPTVETSWFFFRLQPGKELTDLEDKDKEEFDQWVKGVDAVVAAVAD